MTPRHFAYWLLVAMVCAALPSWAAGPATDTSFGTETVSVVPQGEFSKVTVQDCGSLTDVGKPELPVRVLRFVVPSDMRVEDVTISYLVEEELPGFHKVLPAQKQVPIGETAEWTGPDSAIYNSDELYPASRVEYLGDGYFGGYRIASVAIYPLRYAPRSGRLVLASDVSVALELAPAANRAHPRGRMTVSSDELYRDLVKTMVENPWEVDGKLSGVDIVDGISEEGFLPRYTPSLEGSPVEYVIITKESFVPYFQPLADWKTKKGVPTVIRTVAWIEENYQGGTDTTERIRFFIQDAYESWGATYFLLGGDTNIVPVRYGWSAYYGGWEVSSDLYYSDLDGNWNLDGDSKFGEGYSGVSAPGDSVDMFPDVFVGRAPAASTIEAETFVDKDACLREDAHRHVRGAEPVPRRGALPLRLGAAAAHHHRRRGTRRGTCASSRTGRRARRAGLPELRAVPGVVRTLGAGGPGLHERGLQHHVARGTRQQGHPAVQQERLHHRPGHRRAHERGRTGPASSGC